MEPVKILDNIYWVGAVDYDIRDFHGYLTPKGSTYNAYLIVDEKITLIDTVKHGFEGELLSRVAKIVDPKKIDQVISNHAEMDHSGGLPEILKYIGLEKPVYASKVGVQNLGAQFQGAGLNILPVAEKLSVGQQDIHFVETRMIHWPDSMFSFLPKVGVLFSQDGFGLHLASPQRFDDEVDEKIWYPQALNYFANILTLYTDPIAKILEKAVSSGLIGQTKIICPDHGLIWRQNPSRIVELYCKWVQQKPTNKAVIVFDTMWHSTEYIARELTDALAILGVETKYQSLKNIHRSQVVTECFEAAAIIVGSPTINNQMYPSVADFLCYAKGLKFKNKIGAAFGSYGWSGESAKLIQAELTSMGYNLPSPEVRIRWVPLEKDLGPIHDLAKTVAEAIKKVV
ncbi:MAG: flavodoxin domain-containing protein [Deltaproteobacteria bacterium]|jgi:flavorubredoxin|nr:flavodoxin domain-containing protein [Deltaproteobacteria bacterium]